MGLRALPFADPRIQQLLLSLSGQEQASTRGEKRRFAEPLRWCGQEFDTRRRELAGGRAAVRRKEHGRGTARGVVARLRLALDERHLATGRKMARRRGADQPGPNYRYVAMVGHGWGGRVR